jgi:hypothetical protein
MIRESKLIVCAYSAIGSTRLAEAIVNDAWIRAMEKEVGLKLLTSFKGKMVRKVEGQEIVEQYSPSILSFLSKGLRQPKYSLVGSFSRLTDRIRTRFLGLAPLEEELWARKSSKAILEDYNSESLTVIWARALPPVSLQAVIMAYKKNQFPLVVNINDPIPSPLAEGRLIGNNTPCLDRLHLDYMKQVGKMAQAFTFPSTGLLNLVADALQWDRKRCFVLPHLVPVEKACMEIKLQPNTIVFAGTLYPSTFPATLQEAMILYKKQGGKLNFLFILKNPRIDIKEWVIKNFGKHSLLLDLTPELTNLYISKSDAVLITETGEKNPLLRTKLVQAIRMGKKIIGCGPASSTSMQLVEKSGGKVIDQKDPRVVVADFFETEKCILENQWPDQKDLSFLKNFEPEIIIKNSKMIMDFARERFLWQIGNAEEPVIPEIINYP